LNISRYNLRASADRILGSTMHGPSLTVVAIGPRPGTDAQRLLKGLADQEGGTYHEEFVSDSPELLTSNKAMVVAP
jgi:hypothetical protein